MGTPRILFITKQRQAASIRYRATAFFDRLRAAGWEPALVMKRYGGPMAILREARRADVVVICRRMYAPPFRTLLRAASKRLVFDFDDAIFTTPDGPSWRRRWRFAGMIRRCDQVWAGNDYLADAARRWCRDVRVLPTAVDVGRYAPVEPEHKRGDGIDLVWIGAATTRPYLEAVMPALATAAAKVAGLRLRIVADFDLTGRGVETEAVPWSEAGEAEALATSHVGVAPMPDNGWTRGKCGLKVLQYMAAGLPVITTPAGANAQIVVDGETGLYARSETQWVAAIERLASDAALRGRLGAVGRRRVEEHYSLDATFAKMVAALNAIHPR